MSNWRVFLALKWSLVTLLTYLDVFVQICILVMKLIIYMKKLLDSDWLRAVQFKCNTGAKSVTPVQITHRNSELWFTERQREIF